MCVNISVGEKRQPALGFPEGWFFIFEQADAAANPEIHPDVLGLRLISSKGVTYRSVDRAVNRHQPVFDIQLQDLQETYYQQVRHTILKATHHTKLD